MFRVSVNGTEKQVDDGTTAAQVLKGSGAVAARIDGRLVDLATVLAAGNRVEPVVFDSEAGRDVYWHSASHLMAQAVKQLFPDAKVAIGPAIGPCCYTVGEEVRVAACKADPLLDQCFRHIDEDKWRFDLAGANRLLAERAGVTRNSICDTGICTACDTRFFSYRRDGCVTGRTMQFIHIRHL